MYASSKLEPVHSVPLLHSPHLPARETTPTATMGRLEKRQQTQAKVPRLQTLPLCASMLHFRNIQVVPFLHVVHVPVLHVPSITCPCAVITLKHVCLLRIGREGAQSGGCQERKSKAASHRRQKKGLGGKNNCGWWCERCERSCGLETEVLRKRLSVYIP